MQEYLRILMQPYIIVMQLPPVLIGRREFVGLPGLHIDEIEAKIDTGAYTSALHCNYIELSETQDGQPLICFRVLDHSHPDYNDTLHQTTDFKRKRIRSSNGLIQYRYIIRTQLKLGSLTFTTEFSLTNRAAMRYPLLIGRKALSGRFTVDVTKLHIGGL